MSKQSKLAAWQSPAPVVLSTPVIKETPKVEKLTEAILVKEPEAPTTVAGLVEVTPVVEEPKQEIKKLKKNKVEE